MDGHLFDVFSKKKLGDGSFGFGFIGGDEGSHFYLRVIVVIERWGDGMADCMVRLFMTFIDSFHLVGRYFSEWELVEDEDYVEDACFLGGF